MIEIRKAIAADWEAIWPIFQAVIRQGDAFVFAPDTTKEEAFGICMSSGLTTYVAIVDGAVAGSYYIRPNQPGLGSHIANAGYMVAQEAGGRGIGRAMGEHSLVEAKAAGYLAMQFNFVVSANERAVSLWKSLGFSIIGTIPQAFRHSRLGLVDAYIMYRVL